MKTIETDDKTKRNLFYHVIQRLISPAKSVEDRIKIRWLKLQAAILLIFIAAATLYASLQLTETGAGLLTYLLVQSTALVALVSLWLNSRGHLRVAAYISYGYLSLNILIAVLIVPGGQNISYLYVLVLPTVLAGIMMSTPQQISLAAFNSIGIILSVFISPYISLSYAYAPLGCVITIAGLMVVFNRHRDSIENIRRKEIEENELRYRQLVENINDVIFKLDKDRKLIYISPAVERMTQYSISEFENRDFSGIVYPDDLQEIEKNFQQAEEGVAHNVEFRIVNKSKELRHIRFSINRILDENNEVVFNCIATDITQQKKLEDQLRQSQKMESVGRLAGGIAHDFNNLLTVILGYCEMMLEDISDNGIPSDPYYSIESIKGIETAAERAASLTQQLLTFSRKQTPKPKLVNINHGVANQEKMLRRLIGENITLKFYYQPNVHLIHVDPAQMEQVVMNLAVNGAEAMHQSGTLTIRTKNIFLDETFCRIDSELKPGPHVMLVVSDSGTGIKKTNSKYIFDPFFTTKEPGQGTGLGLSTVYGIVKQNHGYIRFESEVNKGTTFYIYFPAAVESELWAGEESSQEPIVPSHGVENLLVVEDEFRLREVITLSLRGYGYNVYSAESGENALELWQQHKDQGLDMLITDVVLPGMNGRELAEQMLKLYPELKILYISGYTENIIQSHGILTDSISFLPKPFSPILLTQKVRQMLNPDLK